MRGRKVNVLTAEEKESYMREAITEAQKAMNIAEVPIGAVVVYEGKIIGRGHNLRETDQQTIAHAEIIAISEANRTLKNWRLENCHLFVTVEPCMMCVGAMILARIPNVYYGAKDSKSGMAGSIMNLLQVDTLNHQSYVEGGILEDTCSRLMKDFFRHLRKNSSK